LNVVESLGWLINDGFFANQVITYEIIKTEDTEFDLGFGVSVGSIGFDVGAGFEYSKSYVYQVGFILNRVPFVVATYSDEPPEYDCIQYCRDHFDGQRAIDEVLESFDIFNLNCPRTR